MTKNELKEKYNKIREQFNALTIPNENTPPTIASELSQNYNAHIEWLMWAEETAYQEGWYQKLVKELVSE